MSTILVSLPNLNIVAAIVSIIVEAFGSILLSRDLPVLTSLRALTFLTRAYVRPETHMHVPLQLLFIPVPSIRRLFFFIQMSLY